MKFRFEFRNPRSYRWAGIKYHAQRQRRYTKRPDGVEVIEWDGTERAAALLMFRRVQNWTCAHLHIEKDGPGNPPPARLL